MNPMIPGDRVSPFVSQDDEIDYAAAYVHRPTVPCVVQTAMQFIHLVTVQGVPGPGDVPVARKRTEGEASALDAAYMVVRHYLTGEMTYSDKPEVYELPPPKHKVYVPEVPVCQVAVHPLKKGGGQ